MPLPYILDVPPESTGWQEWIFNHARDHQEIIGAILTQKGKQLVTYNLDQMNPDDPTVWLEAHQQAHNDMNLVMGIAGNDIETLDFKKPNEVKAWLWLNYQEHLGVRSALKI